MSDNFLALCIGGPFDGRLMPAPGHLDTVVFPIPSPIRTHAVPDLERQNSVPIRSVTYRVHVFHFGPEMFRLLAPVEQPIAETFRQLLGGYRGASL